MKTKNPPRTRLEQLHDHLLAARMLAAGRNGTTFKPIGALQEEDGRLFPRDSTLILGRFDEAYDYLCRAQTAVERMFHEQRLRQREDVLG